MNESVKPAAAGTAAEKKQAGKVEFSTSNDLAQYLFREVQMTEDHLLNYTFGTSFRRRKGATRIKKGYPFAVDFHSATDLLCEIIHRDFRLIPKQDG